MCRKTHCYINSKATKLDKVAVALLMLSGEVDEVCNLGATPVEAIRHASEMIRDKTSVALVLSACKQHVETQKKAGADLQV